MKSAARGSSTSQVEVTNVSTHGFWLLLKGDELFVPFADFPWFRSAPIGKLVDVELPAPQHLYWPELDVDLDIDSILHPEKYPLVAVMPPKSAPATPRPARRSAPQPRTTRSTHHA